MKNVDNDIDIFNPIFAISIYGFVSFFNCCCYFTRPQIKKVQERKEKHNIHRHHAFNIKLNEIVCDFKALNVCTPFIIVTNFCTCLFRRLRF